MENFSPAELSEMVSKAKEVFDGLVNSEKEKLKSILTGLDRDLEELKYETQNRRNFCVYADDCRHRCPRNRDHSYKSPTS